MSCAFPQPPTLVLLTGISLPETPSAPTVPIPRTVGALPGVPAAPVLALSGVSLPPVGVPIAIPLPDMQSLPTLPGAPTMPAPGLALPAGLIALAALFLGLAASLPRSIPCPLN